MRQRKAYVPHLLQPHGREETTRREEELWEVERGEKLILNERREREGGGLESPPIGSLPGGILPPTSGRRFSLQKEEQSSAMVSLRRRRLLGLCSGKSSMPIELSGSIESINVVENLSKNVNPFSIHPMSPVSLKHENPANVQEISISSSTLSTTSSTKEELNNCFLGKEVKRRKRHRRKHFDDQEPCIMRGVYFKNMKWQAAIKVDKKQIHLGTVGSQEEAARLYDRAAFMCGREPNFELSEDEQRELKQYSWDEFLTKTRNAISIKKHQKKTGGGRRKISAIEFHCSDIELERGASGSLSTSDDGEPEASAS